MKNLSLLEQRRIEAGVLIPLLRAFEAEFGVERTREVAARAIAALAAAQGHALGERHAGDSPLEAVKQLIPAFAKDQALELEVKRDDTERYEFDVTRCRFAEFYKEMGVPELGYLLSCNRDFALTRGLGSELELERTQTIMEGASHCDFRFRLKKTGE
jgi:predicted ArsR family transcriptional regulator